MRQGEGKRRHPKDREPDYPLASNLVPDRTADNRAQRHREEEDEEKELRRPNRNAEAIDQIKRVVAREACQIDVFREDEGDQDAERQDTLPRGSAG